MIQRRTRVGAAVLGSLAVAGLAITQTGPVHADPAPQHDDVVGVGSDIIQSSVNFLADGYGSLPGYNTAGNKNRVFNFDATADANGRNAFTDPALGSSAALNPTVTLRAGTSPVRRPNGGGKGITAFIQDGDATNGNRISFVRTPNALTAKNQTNATANGVGDTHTVEFAEDSQYIATAEATNAPPQLSNADLKNIYNGTWTTWAQVKAGDPALSGWTPSAPDATIVPLIPQTGAGVQKVFLTEIGLWDSAANGPSSTIPFGTGSGQVRQVQQNDPSTITTLNATDKPNAIVPFPKGRFALLGQHYFYPSADYDSKALGTPLDTSGIVLQTAASGFKATIPYYIVFRESDLKSTKAWQPGSKLNWVQTLFLDNTYDAGGTQTDGWDPEGGTDNTLPPPFVASPAGVAIINALGLTPKYVDLGKNYTVG
jgi:ABC-type phosphate transport system substrate-binding protein